jgi:hypothetical protein
MAWLDFAPDETQKYVKKNKAAFESGASAPRPTLMDVKAEVQAQVLADNPRATAEQVDAAQTKAEAVYNDLLATERQTQEQAFLSVQQRVDAGELKSYHDLTPQDLALLGDKRNSVRTYIESAQGYQDKILEASPEATTKYYSLYSDSEALRAASVPEIMALASSVGKGRADDLLKRRQHFIDNPDAERAANIDSDMFKAVTQQLGMGSIGAGDNMKKQLVLLEDRTKQAIIERQAEVKRPLTGDEKREIVTTMALEFPKVNVPGGGWFGGDTTKAQRGFQITEPQNIVIPEKDKNEIAQRAKAAGVTIKNDAQWREAYRALLLERNKGT